MEAMHFTDLELYRWRDAGPGADRERVVAHLAVCASCAARYADAIRRRPLTAEEASDAADFAPAGLRARQSAGATLPRPARWMIPVSAAAVLALALAVPKFFGRDQSPTPSPAPTFRGTTVHTLTPSGAVDSTGVAFTWASGIAAGRYRIEIGDAGGVVYSGEAAASGWVPPADVMRRLQPGVQYWWTASALDRGGAPVSRSERRTFSLK